ncbi:MAG TPA: phage head closure protein [Alphaproteobacteria bacterium]|nr:phage head closure protein [Alphaproteobacteria bacterium]
MTGVTIGDLRHRIRLQARILAGDGGGGFAESWSDLAEIWAAIRPSAGAEVTLGEQRRHRVTHEVTIRYRLGVQPGQRLIYDGRALYILGIVNPAERDAFLSLHCEERTSP